MKKLTTARAPKKSPVRANLLLASLVALTLLQAVPSALALSPINAIVVQRVTTIEGFYSIYIAWNASSDDTEHNFDYELLNAGGVADDLAGLTYNDTTGWYSAYVDDLVTVSGNRSYAFSVRVEGAPETRSCEFWWNPIAIDTAQCGARYIPQIPGVGFYMDVSFHTGVVALPLPADVDNRTYEVQVRRPGDYEWIAAPFSFFDLEDGNFVAHLTVEDLKIPRDATISIRARERVRFTGEAGIWSCTLNAHYTSAQTHPQSCGTIDLQPQPTDASGFPAVGYAGWMSDSVWFRLIVGLVMVVGLVVIGYLIGRAPIALAAAFIGLFGATIMGFIDSWILAVLLLVAMIGAGVVFKGSAS